MTEIKRFWIDREGVPVQVLTVALPEGIETEESFHVIYKAAEDRHPRMALLPRFLSTHSPVERLSCPLIVVRVDVTSECGDLVIRRRHAIGYVWDVTDDHLFIKSFGCSMAYIDGARPFIASPDRYPWNCITVTRLAPNENWIETSREHIQRMFEHRTVKF